MRGRGGRIDHHQRAGFAAGAGLLLGACSGPQSALDPAGREAAEVAILFWVMLAGAAAIWLVVIAAALFGSRWQKQPISERGGLRIILWGGAVFPTLVLALLLAYGLRLMPVLRAGEPALTVHVSGEQYWWRVSYTGPDGERIETANELRLPAGRPTEVFLDSADIIHSFWIPALAGKLDMIPGRTNRLVLNPDRIGTYRGVCAEFCGRSHTYMAFPVVVMAPSEFQAWLAREAAPATSTTDDGTFLANGCGGCHTVRGTAAAGSIGPDLTHFADRLSLGAGMLANTPENRRRFIAEAGTLKPGIRMPSFSMLAPAELDAIGAYLGSLR
ncbi:cytochrome c oxidase subunit 2 [Ancylobacter sp. 3268]|uniref:cytochrome c oxidase subunit II n=1 Tax=Ancylobacter sp. 3268 TaxID=2817752 RepID=UPI0028574B40|nr:cytochrome c oxidase subunit II [Ancylobacter sp. 3268]MDR6955551.1 cytochrome c oxidase subunit 2 [Ancylobacter sp. 3268]